MTTPSNSDSLVAAFTEQCRVAVETALERTLTVGDTSQATGSGWSAAVAVSGAQDGALAIWLDDAAATGLAGAMLGSSEVPDPSVVADMLRQLWSEAAAAVALASGLTLVVAPPVAAPAPAAAGTAWMDGGSTFGTIAISGDVNLPRAATVRATRTHDGSASYPGNLASILEVDLPLVARFARTEMPLRALAQLGPGSLVDMGRSPDAPVQLLVGGHVIAEGEVVVVKGNYGVRITSLVSPADRLKAIQL